MSLLLERLKTKLSTAFTAIPPPANNREFTVRIGGDRADLPTCRRGELSAGLLAGCNHGKPWATRSIDATYFRANLGAMGAPRSASLSGCSKPFLHQYAPRAGASPNRPQSCCSADPTSDTPIATAP